jgi:hypothetical protein
MFDFIIESMKVFINYKKIVDENQKFLTNELVDSKFWRKLLEI